MDFFKRLKNWTIPLAFILGGLSATLQIQVILSLAEVFSTIMIKSLKLISLPVIFFSIIATLSGMESFRSVKKLGLSVFKYTLLTTLIAAFTALFLYRVITPSAISNFVGSEAPAHPKLLSVLLDLYPSNIVGIFLEGNVLGVVFLAGLLGLSILSLEEKQKNSLHKFFDSFFSAFLKIASLIIQTLPFGVWAFVTLFVSDLIKTGFNSYKPLFLYFITIVLANFIQGLLVLPVLLKIKGISPKETFQGVSKALAIAFFSKSSNATLPIAMKCMENNLQIPKKISSFSLPLCATINMNACAAFIFTTVVFVSGSFGLSFSFLEMILWAFIATLAAIGNAGVPMGCYFLAGALLSGIGVPLNLLGLILPIYTILDMLETALNVWSDCCVTAIVAKEEGSEAIILTNAEKKDNSPCC
jgi:Na+/H+-dicarboxylate symporter